MSCPDGYEDYSSSDSRKVLIEAYTPVGGALDGFIEGAAFKWSHEVNWNYSYCRDANAGDDVCTMPKNESIDHTDIDVRNVYTDSFVTYNGIISKDDDMSSDEYSFTSYRQARYHSAIPFVGTIVNKYPHSEIEVNAVGISEVIDSGEQ